MSIKRAFLGPAMLLACIALIGRTAEQSANRPTVRLMVQPAPPVWLASLVKEACRIRFDPDSGRSTDPLAANGARFRVSPDSRRVAYVSVTDEGARVVLDGKEGPVYESIQIGRAHV